MESKRQVNIEVLRITAMFLIVVYHYIFYGLKNHPLHQYYDMTSWHDVVDYVTMEPLYIISGVSVNCYVMITGYFLIRKTSLRWRGGISTWVQTLFYSLLFMSLCLAFSQDGLSKGEIINSVFPVFSRSYWFVTSYLGLLVIAPFLSKLALSLNEKQYLLMLGLLFFLNFEYLFGDIFSGARTIMWFSFLYLFSGYIRLYNLPVWVIKYKFYLLIGILIFMFVCGTMINVEAGWNFHLVSTNYNGILFFLSTIVFICFSSFDVDAKWIRPVLWLSPYTFGVYLIHSNILVNEKLWGVIVPDNFTFPAFIYCVLTSAGIFGLCIMIDYGRSLLFSALKVSDVICRIARKLPQL